MTSDGSDSHTTPATAATNRKAALGSRPHFRERVNSWSSLPTWSMTMW